MAWFIVIVAINSCSKSTSTPVSETDGTLLAGAKGATKSWNLTSATVSVNGATAQAITNIPACESDNVFTFTNNSTQDYVETEGATTCASTDPTTVEKGSWGITDDGKNLLIDATYYPTSAQFTAEQDLPLFILSQGEPLQLTKITATTFTIAYSYQDTSTTPATTYSFTVTFTAK
jgi:hypothetical protein